MAITMTLQISKDGENWADTDAAYNAISHADNGAFSDNKPSELIDVDIDAGKATRTRTLINNHSLRVITVWSNDSDYDAWLVEKEKLYAGSRDARNGFSYTVSIS
jgi:hypothetical protein